MHRSSRDGAAGLSSRGLLLAVTALIALAVPVRAAVTMQEKTVSTGLGGFGNGTTERTVVIAGDKSRTDGSATYTGRFKTLAGGGKPKASAEITRLDREVIWSLDPAKKSYTEMTFAEMREAFEKGMAEAQAELDKPENKHAKDVEMTYTVDVKRTGKKETVNGFAAEEFLVTLTATPKDKSTDQPAGTYTMTMDQWMSTAVPGQAEMMAYYRRFAEKMGLDPQMQHMAGGMMSQYGDGLKKMAEKMKDMKGYPVRSTLTVQMGPALTPDQQAQTQQSQADAQKAKAEEKKKKDEQRNAQSNQDAAGSLTSGNVGGAIGGLLGRRLARSAEKKAAASTENGAGNSGAASGALTVTTDLVSCTTGATTASFDVPSDFKKVERRR